METAHINWYGPHSLQHFFTKEISTNYGVYAIYRIYGNKQTLLYIGKTTRSFWQRISEHDKKWFCNIKGRIIIRVGVLVNSEGGRFSAKRLSDVESLLVLWHHPCENTSCTRYYSGRMALEVVSHGRRGLIDREVSTEKLIWA